MIELTPDKYHKVLTLMEQVEFDIVFAYSVIEKVQNGKVFADNENNPTVVLITQCSGMTLLCGNYENEEFNRQIVDIMTKKLIIGTNRIKVFAYPYEWNDVLQNLLGNTLVHYGDIEVKKDLSDHEKRLDAENLCFDHVLEWNRINLKLNRNLYDKDLHIKKNIPEEFTLKRIDENLMKRISGTVIPKHFWTPEDDFVNNGIGYCLLFGDDIASVSFAASIGNRQIDIGMETTPDFRGRGLGIYPATAMIEYCHNNGYEPIWGCRCDNISSYRLAQKLGFEKRLVHELYWSVK